MSATVRGPFASWILPPMNVPTKIIPIVTENGSAAADLLRWNTLSGRCRALEKTLHAYTPPSASCSSTPAAAIVHRP
jgi:hypothetical protein